MTLLIDRCARELAATGVRQGAPLLTVRDLEVSYGGIRAVRGVCLEVGENEVRLILGANGAGKSSIIRTIVGLIRPRSGSIEFAQKHQIHQLPAHRIHRLGVAWVPEGRQVFSTLTVMENLRMGAFADRADANSADQLEWVLGLFPVLKDRATQLAGSLSGGEQQMLAVGRALMSRPRLLVMDEPSLGLAPKVVEIVLGLTRTICARGTSILMAEQNARQALRVADYAYLLSHGEVVVEGSPIEMSTNDDVQRAYLGG
jgi:branched-chain amino acid transport system ATP-binding protein